MDLHLDGLPGLLAALARTSNRLDDAADDITRSGAGLIATEARSIAPKRTGRLAGSIRARPHGHARFTVAATARYAPYVAYGSSHNPHPVPFLEIATARSAPRIHDAAERAVDAAVGELA